MGLLDNQEGSEQMKKEQERILRLLDALFPGVKIYLFGSRARGTYQSSSDIDIALDTGSKIHFLEVTKARKVLEALNIPERIDVLDIHSIEPEMKEIIMKEMKIWKK